MSILTLTHIASGLAGIASGLIVVGGIFFRRRLALWNALFLSTTAAACATGFAFLPIDGMSSAQAVALFSVMLLAVAAYARYVRRLDKGWNDVYLFTAVGALFLNILIATAQSFLHFRFLRAIAPTQHSPVYVAVKVMWLVLFITIAIVIARRAGRQAANSGSVPKQTGTD